MVSVLRRGHLALPSAHGCGIVFAVSKSITQLADQLLVSYAKMGGINHLDGKNLPSKTAITTITIDLLRLLFPGFFDEHTIHSSELKMEVVSLMDSVSGRLEDEIYKSLEYAPPEGLAKKDLRPHAREVTLKFLSDLPHVRELLRTDVDAAYQGDPAALSQEEVIVAYPFVEAIAVQRLAHQLYHKKIPLIPRIMTEWAHARTGMDLHPGAKIGTHFFVDRRRRDVRAWQSREDVSGRRPCGAIIVWWATTARDQTASDARGSRYSLCGSDNHGRRHRYWRGKHNWCERVSDSQRAAKFIGGL